MSFNHEEFKAKLPEYARSVHRDASAEAHLSRCEECREELALLEIMNVQCPDDVPMPEGIFFETLPRRVVNAARNERRSKSLLPRLVPAFAALLIVVAAGVYFSGITHNNGTDEYYAYVSDPYGSDVVDISMLSEEDIPPAFYDVDEEAMDDSYLHGSPLAAGYLDELATLSDDEARAVYTEFDEGNHNGGLL